MRAMRVALQSRQTPDVWIHVYMYTRMDFKLRYIRRVKLGMTRRSLGRSRPQRDYKE